MARSVLMAAVLAFTAPCLANRRFRTASIGPSASLVATMALPANTARAAASNGHRFDSLLEAQVLVEDWRIDYNLNRPHSARGWLSPNEFARAWTNRHQPQLT